MPLLFAAAIPAAAALAQDGAPVEPAPARRRWFYGEAGRGWQYNYQDCREHPILDILSAIGK
jgi:hypothetical protein